VNISGTDQAIDKRKTALSTTIFSHIRQKNLTKTIQSVATARRTDSTNRQRYHGGRFDLLSGGHLPSSLLSEVDSEPSHLIDDVIPVCLAARRFLYFGQSTRRPQPSTPQLTHALQHVRLLHHRHKVNSSLWEPISELRSVTCHTGSHSVTCHPTQVNVNPSHAGRYSIYLPRRDGRLS